MAVSFGETWWGRRWSDALEALERPWANRLPRRLGYAQAGRVRDLKVEPGRVTARVTGSRARPYRVTMQMPVLDARQWERLVEALAAQASFTVRLLKGEMPEAVAHLASSLGLSLFPEGPGDLETACSCPDEANPCKHVAAVHCVLGDALDRDPFLLFELRGRARDQLLEELQVVRARRLPGDFAQGTEPGDRTGRARRTGRGPASASPAGVR